MSLISLLAPHPDLLYKEAITAPGKKERLRKCRSENFISSYLAGGLSRELNPILVVPDNGKLNTLTEQELSCLLSYFAKIHR